MEQDPKIVMSRSKYDFSNPGWSKEFISSLKSGAQELDEELIKSILSKVDDSSLSTESVNKLLMRLGNAALVRESKRMKDQAAQRDINNLIKQLSLGNKNPGIGTTGVKGLKNV